MKANRCDNEANSFTERKSGNDMDGISVSYLGE